MDAVSYTHLDVYKRQYCNIPLSLIKLFRIFWDAREIKMLIYPTYVGVKYFKEIENNFYVCRFHLVSIIGCLYFKFINVMPNVILNYRMLISVEKKA